MSQSDEPKRYTGWSREIINKIVLNKNILRSVLFDISCVRHWVATVIQFQRNMSIWKKKDYLKNTLYFTNWKSHTGSIKIK